MNNKIINCFHRSPTSVKTILKWADALIRPIPSRYGRTFADQYSFLMQSQWWKREEIEKYQLGELKRVVHHAYKNVPFYSDLWDKHRVKPDDLKLLNDIEKFPFTTREDIRNNLDKIVAKNIPANKSVYVTTGGTSGKPVGLYVGQDVSLKRIAFDWRSWNWMGMTFSDQCAVFRGHRVDGTRTKKGVFSEYDPREHYLVFSSFHLNCHNLPQYLDRFLKFRSPYVRGYPSSLEIVADYIIKQNIGVDFVRGINTSSENLFPYQREKIERAFGAKIFDKYGNCEQTNLADQCGESGGYHIEEELGYTELLDGDSVITIPRKQGEIVGTAFLNPCMPLIRYRTEDYAEYASDNCACGRHGRIFATLQGRWFQDQVVTRDNSLIAITSLNSHSDIFDHVEQFQYYQDKVGEIVLRLVRKPSYSPSDERKIQRELEIKLGGRARIIFKYLDNIPRTDRGKYKFLIQKLDLKLIDK